MARNKLYRSVEQQVGYEQQNLQNRRDRRSSAFSGITDIAVNHVVPLLGLLPGQTQERLHATSIPSLDPARATFSSAAYGLALGALLTQIPGDGGIGLTYDYPHMSRSGETVDRPVYFPLGEWSSSTTYTVAGLLLWDSVVRMYQGGKGKATGILGGLADTIVGITDKVTDKLSPAKNLETVEYSQEGYTRREMLQNAATFVSLAALSVSPVGDQIRHALAKPTASSNFSTGLDFTAYNPSAYVEGTLHDTVANWTGNVTATDIRKWVNSLHASNLSIRPFHGAMAVKNERDPQKVFDTGITHIEQLMDNLQAGFSQQLYIRFSSEAESYVPELVRHYTTLGQNPVDEVVKRSASVISTHLHDMEDHKENVTFEFQVDSTSPETLDDLMRRITMVGETAGTLDTRLPIALSIPHSLLEDLASFEKIADLQGAASTVSLDFGYIGEEGRVQEMPDSIAAAKTLFPEAKIFSRIAVSEHVPHVKPIEARQRIAEGNIVLEALGVSQQSTDGVFVGDDNGLLLYKGLHVSSDDPIDGGVMKALLTDYYGRIDGA